ncbi:MAG: hypothetical protein RI601_04705 [Desulfurivibrionaceae bacterium]|nr:hypothetical protein [Desulfurivibrionaceae bacterium]
MSPHFGLLDETKMSQEEALLLRAKLHWRGGKRRIEENKGPEGIVTLYDALMSAMRWHVLTRHMEKLGKEAKEKLEDDKVVIALLKQTGDLDDSAELKAIEQTVHQTLEGGDSPTDLGPFMAQIEEILTRLGILPFDDSELPPEDPDTY